MKGLILSRFEFLTDILTMPIIPSKLREERPMNFLRHRQGVNLVSPHLASHVLVLLALTLVPGVIVAQAPSEEGAVILMYHRFGEDAYPATNTPLEQFEAHLAELKDPKYTVLPVLKIIAALRKGAQLPSRTIGITIDDAYLSVFTEAWPRLNAAGFPFTLFVSTEPLDKRFRSMLTWDQLRTMVASGQVTLGNHTATHVHMADLGSGRNREEIERAYRRIAEETGVIPTLLAYPYGEFTLRVRDLVETEGYEAAFGQHSGAMGPKSDLFALPRYALNETYGRMDRFRLVVNSLPLSVRDVIPVDVLLSSNGNPPLVGFTVDEQAAGVDRLRCHASGQGAFPLRHLGGGRVEGRPASPFPVGRSRINCTLPGPGSRWLWYGRQFYLPKN